MEAKIKEGEAPLLFFPLSRLSVKASCALSDRPKTLSFKFQREIGTAIKI